MLQYHNKDQPTETLKTMDATKMEVTDPSPMSAQKVKSAISFPMPESRTTTTIKPNIMSPKQSFDMQIGVMSTTSNKLS